MREAEACSTLRKMAAFYQCVRPDPSELDMISARVMDMKLREAAEGLGEDGTGKKKSKFKTFKKLFGKKKRKESPSSTGNSSWKQNPAKSEVIPTEPGPVGYDSEDELGESRGTLGNRALSHDSIFFPESGQDPARPVRVFSQENVCDRIKALQLKIQCNVKMGPPPPGGLPTKRAEETAMSSEDDGLPRSPPEMSLLHDVGPGTTIKILVSSSRPPSPDHMSDATDSSRTLAGCLAPVVDFSHPPEFSSCLDNSAAKHKLLVKPRNQRSSKMRRLSSRAQSECLSDLSWTLEEDDYEDKPLLQVSTEEDPGAGQRSLMLGRRPELGGPVSLLLPGGACARRARLQHSAAVSASMEEGGSLRDVPSSRPATPDVTEPMAISVPCLESPSLPESSASHIPHSEVQKEGLSPGGLCALVESASEEVVCGSADVETPLSTDVPEQDMEPSKEDSAPPEGDAAEAAAAASPVGDTTLPGEETAPPEGVTAPPKGVMAPSERDMSPLKDDMVPPEKDMAPSKRIMVPPEREIASSEGGVAPPKRIMAPPERVMSPPKDDVAPPEKGVEPPKRTMATPERDISPPKDDKAPPDEIMEPPNRDTSLPKGDAPPPETVTDTSLETPAEPERQEPSAQEEEELTLVVPRPEGAGTDSSTVPAPSPPVPKSCLKHKASVPSSPVGQDRVVAPPARPRPAQAATSGGPERAAPGRKSERSAEPPQRGVKRFSVTSSRARARASSSRLLEHSGHVPAGGRAPLLRSGLAWRSEAALDDLQVLPESQGRKATGGDPQDSGDTGAGRAGPGKSLQDLEPCSSSEQEAAPREDQSPFPVKLRSTSLSLKYRDSPAQEAKAIKRYSAEVRLERGGLTLLPKDEQSHIGTVPALRGSKSPNGQGKGKTRSPEQPGTKPPLPRKPLLPSLTLPYPPTGPDASPQESERLIQVILPPEPRKEKAPHQGAEKGQPPAVTGPGTDGQATPPWITMARQKRRGAPDLPVNQEEKPGPRILKTETGKQAKLPERAQESVKQGDFVRSKSFLMTPAKPAMTQRQGSKLSLKEGLQRGISLSHQNLAAQAAATAEKELHQLKRASYASTEQPSWMELARKKSQAWSDTPQIIK